MRKISFWRYLAVNRKTIFAALACALLAFSMLGCGTTNHLQTITLTSSGTGGLFNVVGEGGTLQLQATGNYTSGKTFNLTNEVTYQISVTPGSTDAYGFALGDPNATPPQTLQLNKTGLLTAVTPFDCTWVDTAQVTTTNQNPSPNWFLQGSYTITASFDGIVSQPVYVGVASAAGSPDYPYGNTSNENNLSEQCGPTAF